MRTLYSLLLALLCVTCSAPRLTSGAPSPDDLPPAAPPETATFLLGTYNDDGVHQPGIYRYTLLPDGSLEGQGRVAEANNPSFLAYTDDRSHLLAVEELGGERKGNVVALTVQGDQLRDPQRQSVMGAGPCHVNSNAAGYITVATYAGGTLELFRLREGVLSPRLDVRDHHGPSAPEPHAHSSYYTDDGSTVLAADLGTNEVWRYFLSGDKLTAPTTVRMAEGAGPRHLALHPNGKWAYVINELNSTVTQLELDGELSAVASWSTLPDDYTGENYCADIHLSQDGRYLYGSNRGHNSIVAYTVDQQTGALTPLEHEPVAGDWPRNFALSPTEDYLLVANQRSKNITTLRRNKATGTLDFVTSTTTPTPVCILF